MKIFLCLLAGILCLFSSVHADDIYFQEFRAYDLELVYNSGNLRFDFSLVCPDTVGVMMEVRNFSSEVVRSYDIGAFREGSNFIDWDCKDEFGSLLPPGTYTCELKVITFKSPKKLPGSFSYYNSLKRPSPPPFYPDNLPVAQRKWINNSGYNFLCPNCGKCYPEVTAKRLKIRCDGEKDKEKCNFYFATKKQLLPLPPKFSGYLQKNCLSMGPHCNSLLSIEKSTIARLVFEGSDRKKIQVHKCDEKHDAHCLTSGKEDQIYLLERNNERVIELDNSLEHVKVFDRYYNPLGITVDPEGFIWISYINGKILKFSSEGKKLEEFRIDTNDGAIALACDSFGNIYAVFDGMIHKYTNKGKLINEWGTFSNIKDLKINKDNVIFVIDDQLKLYSDDGKYLFKWDLPGYTITKRYTEGYSIKEKQVKTNAHPEGIAVFPDGKHYLACPWEGTLNKYDSPYKFVDYAIRPGESKLEPIKITIKPKI